MYILSIETFYRLGWVTQSDGTGIDLTQYLPFFHSTLCITTEYWHSTLEPSTIGNCLARQQVTLFGLKTLLDWRDSGRECPALVNRTVCNKNKSFKIRQKDYFESRWGFAFNFGIELSFAILKFVNLHCETRWCFLLDSRNSSKQFSDNFNLPKLTKFYKIRFFYLDNLQTVHILRFLRSVKKKIIVIFRNPEPVPSGSKNFVSNCKWAKISFSFNILLNTYRNLFSNCNILQI